MTNLVTELGDWSRRSGPLYQRLSDALRDVIERGGLRSGARLPSERAFARDLAVSRTTVVAAYEALRADGLVHSQHGSGTRVAGRDAVRAHDPDTPGAPVFRPLLAHDVDRGSLISFACAGIPGVPVIADALRSIPPDELAALLADTGYLPWGFGPLRAELAAMMTREGLPTTTDQILVTTGAHQAITLSASLFVRPGDRVIVESPTYPGCADAFAAAGGRLIPVPIDDDGLVLDGLESTVAATAAVAIFVIPAFHNPTGSVTAAHRRRRLAELSGRLSVPVIEDHALALARIDPIDLPPPIASYPGAERAPVITVGSLSKALWGGLRVGWIRAPRPWILRLARRKVAHDLGSGLLDQVVAARLVGQLPGLQASRAAMLRHRLDHTERLLAEHLPDWRWRRPAGGPSLWIRLPFEAGPFCQLALRHGVELIPGSAFSSDGRFADHLRLPFTVDPTVMEEAVRRLRRVVDGYPWGPAPDPTGPRAAAVV